MVNGLETVFKALGEPTRLKIVRLLAEQDLCVCEVVACLDISQPRASQHLKALKKAGIVKERKVRQKSFYCLDEDIRQGLIAGFAQYMKTDPELLTDLAMEWKRYNDLETNPDVSECAEARRVFLK
ncbi:MAG: ArsR/SmtB family transcription factor [Ignavibacteriales bacterium]